MYLLLLRKLGSISGLEPIITRETTNLINITIPIGNYDVDYEDYGDGVSYKDRLSEAMEEQMNKKGKNNYKVTYDPFLNKYLFPLLFNQELIFKTNIF